MNTRPSFEQVKDLIRKNYANREFTVGDIYYSFNNKFDLSIFGTVRNAIVKLSQQGFLNYYMAERGTPRLDSVTKMRGAIYKLKK